MPPHLFAKITRSQSLKLQPKQICAELSKDVFGLLKYLTVKVNLFIIEILLHFLNYFAFENSELSSLRSFHHHIQHYNKLTELCKFYLCKYEKF